MLMPTVTEITRLSAHRRDVVLSPQRQLPRPAADTVRVVRQGES
jgi:hypothetical protein